MEKTISNKIISVNEEGYLTNFSQWDKDLAAEIAKEENIADLTPQHWKIIDYLQDQYKKEIPLSIRKIGKSGVVNIEDFYT
ncbi:MAG: TusE/DsrC/DsvC family sulfur relay protein, partial [Bacteroidia bacterium]|nr:TusE/DsrC/DsvC family sulfur relay protein [Bacteroidia bacterium]